MTINIMNQYVELTKKYINLYLKTLFGKEYNKTYSDVFIEKYIYVRYYNFYDSDTNISIRKKVLAVLKKVEEDLILNHIQDREVIEKMHMFFYYVLYFDEVVYYKDLRNVISKLVRLRKKFFNFEIRDLEEKIYSIVMEWFELREVALNKFDSDIFFIRKISYRNKIDVYKVKLKYKIKFPKIYSEFAIKKAFNLGIINEDKLLIEYYMTVVKIIRDIRKLNFKTHYVVWFADSLLSKNTKLKNLLNIIDDDIIKEKICLKIRFEHFVKNREKIYELMRSGYNIAIILDNSFEAEYKNIESLKIFKYIIVKEDSRQYNDIKNAEITLKNIIIE